MGRAVPVETDAHVRPLGVVPVRIRLVSLVVEGWSKIAAEPLPSIQSEVAIKTQPIRVVVVSQSRRDAYSGREFETFIGKVPLTSKFTCVPIACTRRSDQP
jgi:hypothetical protein